MREVWKFIKYVLTHNDYEYAAQYRQNNKVLTVGDMKRIKQEMVDEILGNLTKNSENKTK